MSAMEEVKARLERDRITIDHAELMRLVQLTPHAHEWIRQMQADELRHLEPATHTAGGRFGLRTASCSDSSHT
jgi:hypothetical protein